MRHFLLILCCTTSLLLTAQDATVRETETDDRYLFSVHHPDGKSKELMRCLNEVTNSNINVKMRGELTLSIAEEATLTVVTKDRTLLIEHEGSDPAARQRTREVVVATRQCLDIPAITSL